MKKFWTTNELLRLKEMDEANLGSAEIARVLGRPRKQVDHQLYRQRHSGWPMRKKPLLDKSQIDEMIELRKQKVTCPEIGKQYGISANRVVELCRNRRRELSGGSLPGFINEAKKPKPYSRDRKHLADVPHLSERYRHIFARDKPPSEEEETAVSAEIEVIKQRINEAKERHGMLL